MAKKKVMNATAVAQEDLSFEETLAELERIVGELEDGELGLNDALARYELGVRFVKRCHGHLERVERKIELLSGIDPSGRPMTEPFDEDCDESLADKAAARGKRRSRPDGQRGQANGADDVDSPDYLF